MHKAYRFLMTTVILLTIATSCGPTPAPQPISTPALPPTPEPAAFPLTITDNLGRDVTVETKPQRIISLAPSNTEILFAIGAGDQVVGITTYCNYPPEAQDREQIGGFSAKTISVEKIVALEPDLVFSVGEIQRPAIEALGQVDITVVALDPNDFDEVYATIELMGRLTGHEQEAAQIVADMKARVAAVRERVATIPEEERLTVFWETYDEPLMTVGAASFTHQLIELAGGVNIFADLTETYPQVNAEEVVKRNPAVIMGADSMGDKLTTELVGQRPGWGQVQAVQDGRIHLFNGDMVSRTGPRLAQVLEEMARALYPDVFE
jgi:iron complex transport system substrate-binding protein